jgi:23S rRNA pseudouridine1911/1915/1917 synthase
VTHRLDNPTEGLLLFAKNKRFQTQFNQLLKEGKIKKLYQAQVQGTPRWEKNTLLTHYMKPSPRGPKEVSKEKNETWAECRLNILQIQENQILIELLTGRTHQIRAQLSCEGFPIIGDHLYGATKIHDPDSIALKAIELHFLDYQFKLPTALL